MTMTVKVATTAILLTLFIHYAEGFQWEHVLDDSFSDDVDVTRATQDENGSGISYIQNLCCVHDNTLVLTYRLVQ